MENNFKQIRLWILFFMIALIISGVTAFPIETELEFLIRLSDFFPTHVSVFFTHIYEAVKQTNQQFPFLFYGYDWLAFAHIIIAILFIGPFRNPVKNIWVIEFGIIACVLILPMAFICGNIRQIPLYWQLIDCSFGIFGIIPLLIVYKKIKLLKNKLDI